MRYLTLWLTLFVCTASCATPRIATLSDTAARDVLAVISDTARPRFASAREQSWIWTGEADYLGEPSTFHFEWGEACFRREVEGRLGRTVGFDGAAGWSRSSHGLVRPLVLEELDRERMITAAMIGGWIDAEAPLRVRAVTADESTVTLELTLDDSPMMMTMIVDRASGEPQTLSRKSESGTTIWLFEGWQVRQGALVPGSLRHRAADGQIENRVDLRDIVRVEEALDLTRFARPANAPTNVTFHEGVHPRIEARRASTGHLLVRPIIDGREVGWFVFDSGAGGLVIDSKLGDALELKRFGEVVAVGVSGQTNAAFRQARSFRLGPLELGDPIFVEISLSFLEGALGMPIAGLVGYDVLAHATVLIEQAESAGQDPVIEIHEPGSNVFAELEWHQLVLDERLPCIEANFEGDRSGLFKLDTGASGNLTFHAPAVKSMNLKAGRKLIRTRTSGVGGIGNAWRGPLEWLELAGLRFENLTVEFADGELGSFADVYTLGNLGQGLLSQFRIVFDYTGERVALVPR